MNETKTHSIKLTDPVYLRLDRLRGKGQTFSQAVDNLCGIVERVMAIALGQGEVARDANREDINAQGQV